MTTKEYNDFMKTLNGVRIIIYNTKMGSLDELYNASITLDVLSKTYERLSNMKASGFVGDEIQTKTKTKK